MFRNLGEILILLCKTIGEIKSIPRQSKKILEQLFEMGYASLLMAGLLSLFIGAILAIQVGPELTKHGLSGAIGGVVGLAMARELAPVMMAILIIGRVGSAITAEIGSMKVYNEVDALESMNISPIRFLFLPRLVAISIALPMITFFSVVVGWLGAEFICSFNHSIALPTEGFLESLRNNIDCVDIVEGLVKSVVFALFIGIIACHQGVITLGGPRGIGRSVTKSVVNSIVAVLLLDYFVTRFFIFMNF